ncbi:MAG: type II toxin-antitoxin system VapC family toxin [Dehalococcoidia bacterium]
MSFYYVDSSALLKAYVREKGSARAEEIVQTGDVAISMLTVVELASALARRSREGTVKLDQRHRLFDTFLAHAVRFQVLPLPRDVLDDAAALLLREPARVPLRTLDAIHLATAEWSFILARQAGEAGVFVSADKRLIAAATAAGMTVEDPEERA